MKDKLLVFAGAMTLLVVVGRFTVPGHGLSYAGTYEALAHIWCGAMIVLTVYEWNNEHIGKLYLFLLLLATALETVMFLLR